MKMKYVIVDGPLCEVPIVFSELQQHADVAHHFARRPQPGETYKDVIIGAGFCHLNVEETEYGHEPRFECYGESVSLGVESRGDEDSKVLNKMFGLTREY